MEEKRYTNLWKLFQDVLGHETVVTSTDDPTRLWIGWAMPHIDKWYYVTLTDLRSRRALPIPFPSEESVKKIAYDKLTTLLMASGGRTEIAQYLSGQLIIPELTMVLDKKLMERLNKLKAFW